MLKKYPLFILPPATQFVLGSQMGKNGDCRNAAETLYKIPFTFPDAPEGELSLLHSAQIYLNQLDEPQMTKYLLETLLQRYPESEWLAQAQKGIQLAERRMAEAQAAELQTGAPPSTFPNASAGASGGAGVAGAPPTPTFTPSIRKLSETRPPQKTME